LYLKHGLSATSDDAGGLQLQVLHVGHAKLMAGQDSAGGDRVTH